MPRASFCAWLSGILEVDLDQRLRACRLPSTVSTASSMMGVIRIRMARGQLHHKLSDSADATAKKRLLCLYARLVEASRAGERCRDLTQGPEHFNM